MKLTSEYVLNRMKLSSDEERAEAKEQLELRGAFQYNRIVDLLVDNGLEPSYDTASALYRYDKRLRFNLYKYISMLEEYLRAIIGNYYDSRDTEPNISFNNKSDKYPKIEEFKYVGEYLKEITLGALVIIAKDNKEAFDGIYNIDSESFDSDMDAIKVFRDKIDHQAFLQTAELSECIKYGDKTLKSNLLNLRDYLPESYKVSLTDKINKCVKGLNLPEELKIII